VVVNGWAANKRMMGNRGEPGQGNGEGQVMRGGLAGWPDGTGGWDWRAVGAGGAAFWRIGIVDKVKGAGISVRQIRNWRLEIGGGSLCHPENEGSGGLGEASPLSIAFPAPQPGRVET
jgi:hypothetical protein